MRARNAVLISIAGLMLGASAGAHHSPAMLYDLGKQVTIEGVVTEFQMGNPHLRIYFEVERNGVREKWLAEGGSRTVLMHKGWTGKEVAPGDKVSVIGNPSRDGSKLVHVIYLVLPDGKRLFAEDFDPTTQYDELRRKKQQ
ncbi:MAG TPA: DUF6152 family protein [Gammaproteobacteria bacterium]|jgi:hypothetical protein|nr:DUF6152 family protein [Gammaproteobacteria bacterium]